VQEVCLGIMGNLACHESLVNAICLEKGLITTVVNQLFLDDVKCLSEAFRLDMFEIKSFFYFICWTRTSLELISSLFSLLVLQQAVYYSRIASYFVSWNLTLIMWNRSDSSAQHTHNCYVDNIILCCSWICAVLYWSDNLWIQFHHITMQIPTCKITDAYNVRLYIQLHIRNWSPVI
jgi:hypothetical protein